MMTKQLATPALLLAILMSTAGLAEPVQRPKGPKVLSLELTARPAPKGVEGVLEIVATIEPNYHINSSTPTTEFMIPTAVKFKANSAVIMGPTQYPKGIDKRFAFSEDKLSIYEGRMVLKIPYKAAPNTPAGKILVQGVLSYQACTDKACLPPRNDDFEVTIDTGAGRATGK